MKKRVAIGCVIVIIAVVCLISILVLKSVKRDSDNLLSNAENDEVDFVYNEVEETQIAEESVSNDIMPESEEDVSSEDITEEEEVEDTEEEEEDTDKTTKTYEEHLEEFSELSQKDELTEEEQFYYVILAQTIALERMDENDKYSAKLQEAMEAEGISGSVKGRALVSAVTEEDEPYYSILQSVDATKYYFTVNGAVSDTVYLFYLNQDDEVVYYGFVDLLDY